MTASEAPDYVSMIHFSPKSSGFGELVPIDFNSLPFVPKRVFHVSSVPVLEKRGVHAHRHCHQILFALAGNISVEVTNGVDTGEILLSENYSGLHIPPMIWASQTYLTNDSMLLVLASHGYSRADYIEDYEEFLRISGLPQPGLSR